MAERVFQLQQGKIRDKPIAPELAALLETVGNELDVYFEVTSGGQDARGSGGKRTGSVRHDHGKAADIKAYTLADGKKSYLDHTSTAGQKMWGDIVRLSVAGGATGIGAGKDYMGGQTVHIGYGNKGTWGAGGRGSNAPEWLTTAFDLGTKTPPLSIPDVASLTDTGTAYAPTPARKSSALEAITGATGGRVASPGIPSAYESPKTPQQVASLYEGILPARNGLSAFPGGPVPMPRSPTLFGDTVGIPDDMMSTRPDGSLDPSYRLYGPDNRMSVGGLGSLLGGRTIPPAMPNSPPVRPTTSPPGFGLSSAQRTAMAALPSVPTAPTVGGVGGANIAGQVQLPRNVVPASVQRDLAAINALPSLPSPFDTIGAFPSALSLAQMRTTGRAPTPMPTISRSGSPFPASYAQMQSARSRYAAPIPASRRSVAAPVPASRLVAPVPMPRPSSRTSSNPELQAVHDYVMGTGGSLSS